MRIWALVGAGIVLMIAGAVVLHSVLEPTVRCVCVRLDGQPCCPSQGPTLILHQVGLEIGRGVPGWCRTCLQVQVSDVLGAEFIPSGIDIADIELLL
jgi:hypothetical protein